MFETLIYNDIDPGKVRKQFDRTIEQLSRGDFALADVKKMAGLVITGLNSIMKIVCCSNLPVTIIKPAY